MTFIWWAGDEDGGGGGGGGQTEMMDVVDQLQEAKLNDEAGQYFFLSSSTMWPCIMGLISTSALKGNHQ